MKRATAKQRKFRTEVDKFRAFYYQPVDNIWRETYKPPVDVRCYILDTTGSLCNGSVAPQKNAFAVFMLMLIVRFPSKSCLR